MLCHAEAQRLEPVIQIHIGRRRVGVAGVAQAVAAAAVAAVLAVAARHGRRMRPVDRQPTGERLFNTRKRNI